MTNLTARVAALLLALTVFCAPLPALAQAVAVSAARLDTLLVQQELRAPASVLSANRAEVRAEVPALIDAVLTDVGAAVASGDLLVRLDGRSARLGLEQARAGLTAIDAQIKEAQSRLTKAEELLERDFISDEELISRQAALAVLQANRREQQVRIRAAELDVARTRITAPFDATVTARQAQVGSYAQPGSPLITLVQSGGREIDVELDPRHSATLPSVPAFRFASQGRSWPVTLLRLSDVIETSSRIVRARFAFTDGSAPIGASGQLVWTQPGQLIPVDLIVQRENRLGVFIADGTTARFVELPGAQAGRPALTTLPAASLLITRGHTRLQDGDAIQVAQ